MLCEDVQVSEELLSIATPFCHAHGSWPVDWMHLAQDREVYREVSRWIAFKMQL